MFLITFNFIGNLPTDQQLAEHRSYIDKKINEGLILLAGPKDPRTGGVIVALTKTEEEAKHLVEGDPYFPYQLADYQITKFNPVKYRPEIAKLV